MLVLIGILVALSTLLIVRARSSALRLQDDLTHRVHLEQSGIVAGAAEIDLQHVRSRHGVLLLHGGGDTPQTLRYLAEYLHARGYNVRVPLLPGHGRTLHAFASVNAEQWLDAARDAYRELARGNSWVAVGGLSMGGAIAVRLAAEDDTIPVLGLMAPYLTMPRRIAVAARFARLWGFAVPFVRALDPTGPRSIRDPVESQRSLAYGVFTPAALRALYMTVRRAFEDLPAVNAPTLMIQSREDNRIAPRDAQRAFDRLGVREKQLIWITGAGHVITVDYGRDRVFEMLADWFEQHRPTEQQERPA